MPLRLQKSLSTEGAAPLEGVSCGEMWDGASWMPTCLKGVEGSRAAVGAELYTSSPVQLQSLSLPQIPPLDPIFR